MSAASLIKNQVSSSVWGQQHLNNHQVLSTVWKIILKFCPVCRYLNYMLSEIDRACHTIHRWTYSHKSLIENQNYWHGDIGFARVTEFSVFVLLVVKLLSRKISRWVWMLSLLVFKAKYYWITFYMVIVGTLWWTWHKSWLLVNWHRFVQQHLYVRIWL